MRTGLKVLGWIHVLGILGIFSGSPNGFVIGSIIAAIVAFWRATRPKSSTGMEIAAFVFMYMFLSGFLDGLIADKKLTIWYIIFAVVSIILFVLCERIINGKKVFPISQRNDKQSSNQQETFVITKVQTVMGAPKTKPQSSLISAKYKDELYYDRLKRLCNPANFIENYDKEKVDNANVIYSELLKLDSKDSIALIDLIKRAEKTLHLNFLDEYDYNDLKNSLNPQNFMEPYDTDKVTLANELYSQILQPNTNYTKYVQIEEDAKPLFDYLLEKEKREIAEKFEREKKERERKRIAREKEREREREREIEEEKELDKIFLIILLVMIVIAIGYYIWRLLNKLF